MENKFTLQNLSNEKLLTYSVILTVLNASCLVTLAKKQGVYNLDGSYTEANTPALIFGVVIACVFVYPLTILLLSSLIAAFTNKQLPYKQRLIRTFLFAFVIIYSIAFLRFTYNILTF